MKLTAEQIIRNINLHLLSDIELEEPYYSIYNDLNEKVNHLKAYQSTVGKYNDGSIFYGENKVKLLFTYHTDSKNIYIDGEELELFSRKYKIPRYTNVLRVFKYFIKMVFKEEINNFSYINLSNSGNYKYKLEHVDI